MSTAGGLGGNAGLLNYTVLVPIDYDGSNPTGGDSLVKNLNVHYEVCASIASMVDSEANGSICSPVTLPGCSPQLPWCCS